MKVSKASSSILDWLLRKFPSLQRELSTTRFILLTLCVALFSLLPFRGSLKCSSRYLGYDLALRYNECRCILDEQRIPADVVSGRVESKQYAYFMDIAADRQLSRSKKPIHSYPPWAYGLLLPIAKLGVTTFTRIVALVNIAALLFLGFFGGYYLRKQSCPSFLACLAPLLVLSAYTSIRFCIAVANFGILITAAYLLVAIGITSGKQGLTIIGWTLAMMKPQFGLLLAIPILCARQWIALVCTPIVCFLLSCLPAYYLNISPINLILKLTETGAQARGIHYTEGLFAFLHYTRAQNWILPLNFLSCISVVLWSAWKGRHFRNGLLAVAPVALCTLWGSYSQPHDRMLLFLPLWFCVAWLLTHPIHHRTSLAALLFSGLSITMSLELHILRRCFSPWSEGILSAKLFTVIDPLWWLGLIVTFIIFFSDVTRQKEQD